MDASAVVATLLIVRQIERLLPEYAQRLGYTMDFGCARKSLVFEPLAGRAIFVRAADEERALAIFVGAGSKIWFGATHAPAATQSLDDFEDLAAEHGWAIQRSATRLILGAKGGICCTKDVPLEQRLLDRKVEDPPGGLPSLSDFAERASTDMALFAAFLLHDIQSN